MRSPPGLRRLLRQLEKRGVLRVAGLYAAGSFLILQVADLVLPALPLPDGVYTGLVLVTLFGFPLAVAAAWMFDLTEQGLARAPAGLDGYEHAPPPPRRRLRVFSAAMILALVAGAAGLLAFRTLLRAPADGGRMAIAVFPFSASGAPEWTEGVPDLLATALDGTESLHVLDTWALWTVLRDEPSGPARVPDPASAGLIAADRSAHRYLLGTVVDLGNRVDIVARLYRAGVREPLETFRVGGAPGTLPALVDRLAIQVITVAAGEQDPALVGLQRNATKSPDALKAYLMARSAMRRGMVDSAVTAIDRAVAIDSTFALAWLEAVHIHSWAQQMRGEPYSGLFEMLDRVDAHADSLTERNRLRATAMRALVRTDGPAAATALNRIIELDNTDLAAWASLTYCHMVYGWQYGAAADEAARAADRVIALDSAYLPGLVARAWLALAADDTAAGRRVRDALGDGDNQSFLARTTLDGLRALATSDSALPALAESLARRGVGDWIAPYRFLRLASPDRAEVLLRGAAAVPDPQVTSRVAGELFRLDLARGRVAAAGRELASGSYARLSGDRTGERFVVATALVGLGDSALAARAVETLHAFVPPDSASVYLEQRPVWWTAWVAGAYHAQLGDTAQARRWQDAIRSLPPGGTSPDYRGSLTADIDARILARTGDLDRAIAAAERALELWGIHTEMSFEALPEPQMRFHLAVLRKARGETEPAGWLFRSLIPPTTWLGFLTARAWYELGSLAEDAGDIAAARRYYERVLTLWEGGDAEIREWRDQARRALARTMERSAN